jgi:hypothetical protein
MKRSEMIEIMEQTILDYEGFDIADALLTAMEEAGMFPPPEIYNGLYTRDVEGFEWEPEDA